MERAVIENLKRMLQRDAMQMRKLNRMIVPQGERFDIPADGREINVVFYRAASKNKPLVLGFHGGGFAFGGNAMNDKMWTAVRDRLDLNIASIEYRKSPEYQWREALQDAYDAGVYLQRHAAELGADPDSVYVFGSSAGACLATSLCLYAKENGELKIQKQILNYPFLDCDTDPESKGAGSISGPVPYVFNEWHVQKEEARNPLVSPVFATAEQLKGMPDAIITYAGFDNLKQEGMKYAEKLREVGVQVQDQLYPGMPHAFFENGFGFSFEGEEQHLSEEERKLIADGSMGKAAGEALEFIAHCLQNES